jgi:hypothetical protein
MAESTRSRRAPDEGGAAWADRRRTGRARQAAWRRSTPSTRRWSSSAGDAASMCGGCGGPRRTARNAAATMPPASSCPGWPSAPGPARVVDAAGGCMGRPAGDDVRPPGRGPARPCRLGAVGAHRRRGPTTNRWWSTSDPWPAWRRWCSTRRSSVLLDRIESATTTPRPSASPSWVVSASERLRWIVEVTGVDGVLPARSRAPPTRLRRPRCGSDSSSSARRPAE